MMDDREGGAGARAWLWLALLHLACCGGPPLILLLISAGVGVSLAGLLAALPSLAGIGAALALGAVIFSCARRCPACGRRGAWMHDLRGTHEAAGAPRRGA